MSKKLAKIIFLMLILVTTFGCGEKEEIVGPPKLSQKAQIVRDYLAGEKIPGEDVWWLNEPNVVALAKRIAKELNLEDKDGEKLWRKLQPRNFVLVYKSANKKIDKKENGSDLSESEKELADITWPAVKKDFSF